MRLIVLMMVVPCLVSPLALGAGRAMTVDDLLAVKSVGDPQVSPDGKHVVYVLSELDRATNKSNSDLYLIALIGGEPKRLTTAPGADNHPRWSPDGKSIAFNSSRSGSMQIWILPIDGGEARQVTKLPIEANGPVWSPTGDRIAFAAEVYPGKTPEETAATEEAKTKEKANVRIFDDLMIRHWDRWDDGKRSHIFTVEVDTGKAIDLSPSLARNSPPAPFGGSSDYTFTPDGKFVVITAEPSKDLAWSTNTDLHMVPATGGDLVNLTAANPGADAQPAFSPTGTLAYLSQARAGFEADQWVLKTLDLKSKTTTDLSSKFDRPIQSFSWVDARRLVAVLDDGGTEPILFIPADGSTNKAGKQPFAVAGGVNTSPSAVAGSTAPRPGLVYLHGSTVRPAEVHYLPAGSDQAQVLTHHNDALIAQLDLHPAELFHFPGADGDPVAGWLIKPPGFDPSKKYPVVFLIHGGPQGAWHDEWHARWNPSLFAAPGYAVVAINPRGSTGFGQKFTDQISQDWTGRVYEDLMKGLDYVLKENSFLDGSKVAAAGGSYGGFMVNWIAGHSDRFRALISHAGVYDLASMYGTTEELWFAEWEFGGASWQNPKLYLDQSPSAFAASFQTPTLITHGSMDFRVPEAQGLGFFTALRRQGVPARLVIFPEENHWVLKPANRIVWWREMHDWLAKYLQ